MERTLFRRALLRRGLVLASLGIASSADARRQTAGGQPMFGVGARNSGHNPDEGGPAPPATARWHFQITDGVAPTSPAVVDGTVFVGKNPTVYALDAADGSQQWTFDTDDWVYSSPAVVDETVYVGSDDGTLYALSADDGTEQWHFETDEAVWSSPAVVDDTVYVGNTDGSVYAIGTGESGSGSSGGLVQTLERNSLYAAGGGAAVIGAAVAGLGRRWYRTDETKRERETHD